MILDQEKRRADLMRRLGQNADYKLGYRIGLVGQSEHHHELLLAGIGSADLGRDARGRGYRDGLARKDGAA